MATDKELQRRDDKPRQASPATRHAGSNQGNMGAREARQLGGDVSREQYGRPGDRQTKGQRGRDAEA